MARLSHAARLASAALLTMSVAGCAGNGPLSRLTREASAYERYAEALADAGLHETALGRDWLTAGRAALEHPTPVTLPFSETGYFAADRTDATAFRFDVPEGRRLSLDVSFESSPPGRLFVDLFEARGAGEAPRRIGALDTGATTLTHDVARGGTFIVRVQPELLRSGRFTLTQRTLASLPFPVPDLTASAVQSVFGAARDAGRREHEGIDIFAPRGTPVVAVVSGIAQTGTNTLGGNVVWLHEPGAGRTFYYAHLDRWAFDGTMTARAGDVLGHVGNTGNARTTAPHLHFGLYARGAVDPLPYLLPDDPIPAAPAAPDRLGEPVRIPGRRATLRSGPAAGTPRTQDLPQGTLAEVIGASGRTYRIRLPDETVGYIDASSVSDATAALGRQRLGPGDVLREAPQGSAPVVATVAEAREADILGRFGAYAFVRTPDGDAGWVEQ